LGKNKDSNDHRRQGFLTLPNETVIARSKRGGNPIEGRPRLPIRVSFVPNPQSGEA